MEKAIGIILGLVSAFIGSIGFYQAFSQTDQNNSGGLVMAIIMWCLAIIIVWLGFNVKKLETKTVNKTSEKLNQIKGFSNNTAVIDNIQIKVFHNISLSLLKQHNYLTIGIELNDTFTDIEKGKLKREFTNEKIENKEYLVFNYTSFLYLNQNRFQKKLSNIIKAVLSKKSG